MNKLSLNFLKINGVCDAAYAWTAETFAEQFAQGEFIDWDFGRDALVAYCEQQPNETQGWIEWFDALRRSEAYVRFNGEQFTMSNYQVFNPLTGTHAEYETEAEARAAVIVVSEQVLAAHKVSLVRSITNEHGDSAWIAVELSEPIVLK